MGEFKALAKCARRMSHPVHYSTKYTLRKKCLQHGDVMRSTCRDRESGLKIHDGTGTQATAVDGPKAPPHGNLETGSGSGVHIRHH